MRGLPFNQFGLCVLLFFVSAAISAGGESAPPAIGIPKFDLPQSGLELTRRTQSGSFFDAIGHKSAVFGYENRALEAWVYPLKIIDGFQLAFRLEGDPLDIPGSEFEVSIVARPEATIFTYSHAAFTVREIMFAPVDEPGIVMLLDIHSVLPLTVTASFRPRLRLFWPAGPTTNYVRWDEHSHFCVFDEESRRYVGLIGTPAGRDISPLPDQEEARDALVRLAVDVPVAAAHTKFIPIIIAGSATGMDAAKATYVKLLGETESLYRMNVEYYRRLENETVSVTTPDQRLNTAFAWSKIGVDKGIASNPLLGTGLLAGFRTSGESERPGFAWFFGRDALWTSLAMNSYGDFAATRAALDFLKRFQREDGKIPHEISQSASLLNWFTDYPYAWASADATPLYVIAHDDYWRASGDLDFIRANWDSILKAYRFSAATDTDRNGLIENTTFGTGWVEGGALYPPHEEIYLQGLWIEACRSVAELADQMKDPNLAAEARAFAERTRAATEKVYWLPDRSFYAFATKLPSVTPPEAEPGPNRAARQARMNELSKATVFDEDTVMPAVPLWWHELEDERAQSEIDHLGSAGMATDWGDRLITERSALYDPLSYHHGSVWPLFTGWAGMAAYQYGRPHVGYQALMANANLTFANALGYVTELLSGEFNTEFGHSSHHQVWSEAMVATLTLRGLLGLEVSDGGKTLRFAPQLPADWDKVCITNVAAGGAHFDIALTREHSGGLGREIISVTQRRGQGPSSGTENTLSRVVIAPSFPLDVGMLAVNANGRKAKFEVQDIGDVKHVQVVLDGPPARSEVTIGYSTGTDVYAPPEPLQPGQPTEALRVIRSRADGKALHLTLEGLGGHQYRLSIKTHGGTVLHSVNGATITGSPGHDPQLLVNFEGPADSYIRREIDIPMNSVD